MDEDNERRVVDSCLRFDHIADRGDKYWYYEGQLYTVPGKEYIHHSLSLAGEFGRLVGISARDRKVLFTYFSNPNDADLASTNMITTLTRCITQAYTAGAIRVSVGPPAVNIELANASARTSDLQDVVELVLAKFPSLTNVNVEDALDSGDYFFTTPEDVLNGTWLKRKQYSAHSISKYVWKHPTSTLFFYGGSTNQGLRRDHGYSKGRIQNVPLG